MGDKRKPEAISSGESRSSETSKTRWSRGKKRDAVLRMLRGEPIDALSRELGVESYRLQQWRDRALAGLDEGLRERDGDPLEKQLDDAMRRIGELSMEVELLRDRCKRNGPFVLRTSR